MRKIEGSSLPACGSVQATLGLANGTQRNPRRYPGQILAEAKCPLLYSKKQQLAKMHNLGNSD